MLSIDLYFLGFAANLLVAAILTITAPNPVGALMGLIFAFINAACLFFLMDLEFVGLLFLIVYVGAIAVLFLFSVMLFNLKDVVRAKTTSFILKNLVILACGLCLLFILEQTTLVPLSDTPVTLWHTWGWTSLQGSIFYLGQLIYGTYALYLILASVILLITMIGAVILINNPREQSQNQHVVKQVTRGISITNLK